MVVQFQPRKKDYLGFKWKYVRVKMKMSQGDLKLGMISYVR